MFPTKVRLNNLESGGLTHTVVPIDLQYRCKVNGQRTSLIVSRIVFWTQYTKNMIGIVGAHNT